MLRTSNNNNNNQDSAQESYLHAKEMWKGCSLKSVPINMIQFCLHKATSASNNNNSNNNTTVVIDLAKGGYRYRAEKLCSIDESMNVRLENILVTQKKRPSQMRNNFSNFSQMMGFQQQQNQSQGTPSTATIISRGAQNNLINNNNNHQQNSASSSFSQITKSINTNLETIVDGGLKKGILLTGSSIVTIQLPEEWGETFEEHARAVRAEMYRRKREKEDYVKELRRKKKAAVEIERKEKKAKKESRLSLMHGTDGKNKAKAGKGKSSSNKEEGNEPKKNAKNKKNKFKK